MGATTVSNPAAYDGGTYSITFTAPGTYQVTCTVHPAMNMTITVQ